MTGKPKRQELLSTFLSGRWLLRDTNILEMSRFSGPMQEGQQTLQASCSLLLAWRLVEKHWWNQLSPLVNGSSRSFLEVEWPLFFALTIEIWCPCHHYTALMCHHGPWPLTHDTDLVKIFQKQSKHEGYHGVMTQNKYRKLWSPGTQLSQNSTLVFLKLLTKLSLLLAFS